MKPISLIETQHYKENKKSTMEHISTHFWRYPEYISKTKSILTINPTLVACIEQKLCQQDF